MLPRTCFGSSVAVAVAQQSRKRWTDNRYRTEHDDAGFQNFLILRVSHQVAQRCGGQPAGVPPRTERGNSAMTAGIPVADSGATKILLLLTAPHPRGMGLMAGGAAPEERLKERFLGNPDRNKADYEQAMESAIDGGWVQRISTRVRLTEDGHKLCSGSNMGDDQISVRATTIR